MAELRKVYTTVDARDRIIEAALTVFAQRGFDGATTRAIAKEADVSSALIHHHFKDKENLWRLVGQRISEEFIDFITSTMTPQLHGSAAGVKQMVAAYMRYWRDHPRSLKFQLWRVLGAPMDERKSRSKQLTELFVPEVKAAQDAGHVHQHVPPGLLLITVGGLVQYFLHSDVETADALDVTGAAPMTDDQMLEYLMSLITPAETTTTHPANDQPRQE